MSANNIGPEKDDSNNGDQGGRAVIECTGIESIESAPQEEELRLSSVGTRSPKRRIKSCPALWQAGGDSLSDRFDELVRLFVIFR